MTTEHDNERDAMLTAYALDELDAAGRAAVERRLIDDPPARREVEEIRATAALLRDELAAEPLPEPASPAKKTGLPLMPLRMANRARRFSWRGRLAVAAAVAVVVGGVAFSVLAPSLNRAREVASPARLAPDAANVATPGTNVRNVGVGAGASGQPSDAKKVPYGDILRYPPELSSGQSPRGAAPAQQPQQQQGLAMVATPASPPIAGAWAAPSVEPSDPTARRQLNYSFQEPYQRTSDAPARQKLETSLRGEYAVSSDINPGTGNDGFNTEAYDRIVDNRFLEVVQNPLSTFSIDVDTASYSNMRRFLNRGQLPPKDSVRIEELVNYFPYDYAPPEKGSEDPFAAHVEVAECPWEAKHRLVRIALKGKEIAAEKRPASNLVFLLDVSGSMNSPNKLPLVQRSMRMLLDQLNGEDRVAIVVYAGQSGMVLSSTACTDRDKPRIQEAINSLSAGGSTNGEQGIQLAYSVATQNFIESGTNRVILCTDGDFNVGVTSHGDLTRTIEEKAKSGVFLSVLGFGMGNLKDSTMETLADKGNGNYGYIDTESEAKKLLVEQMSGTLITIAKDVKIQVEFNPAVVGAYRLIGYENRMLAKEDFNDDKKDAGEIGAGHAVTALYEIVPAGIKTDAPAVDELKYQKPAEPSAPEPGRAMPDEMLTLKLRYKQPDGDTSKLTEVPVKDLKRSFQAASVDFKFASAVAGFGMILRESPHKGSATVDAVLGWAEDGMGDDASGYRREFIELVKRTRAVAPSPAR